MFSQQAMFADQQQLATESTDRRPHLPEFAMLASVPWIMENEVCLYKDVIWNRHVTQCAMSQVQRIEEAVE